jgi:hypothetical protein
VRYSKSVGFIDQYSGKQGDDGKPQNFDQA